MNIIATVGPKTIDKWIIKELIESGVDILRLNCAHFSKEEFELVIKYSKSIKSDIHILVDLSGKKVRISNDLKYIYKIYNNQEVFFCGEDYYNSLDINEISKKKYIPLNITTEKIKRSNVEAISIKDNTMKFEVLDVSDGIVKTKVMKGGIIRAGKGCNITNIYDEENIISKKDKENIIWALDNNLDIICQSFVESKRDIDEIKRYIYESTEEKNYDIWAKIETPMGINNIDYILKSVDTVVIGRGDLVPEAGLLDAIKMQEKVIKVVKRKNKRVIIGTHLLNSMKNGNPATLPEVESIYKFINDGVDGFLLAGETSIGKAPIQTVKFLKSTIDYYKKDIKKYE
ncbi:pyruvate kinase [Clostridium sp. AL.422]|uniref:pyruvate kinase n=1 Tax=Clostridium TaxID=1485 RepID=UPI00293DC6D0|nr:MULTISPECIES: pyruvate kinase [unclassified Clostridium]MDV4152673.1 pyruvate kinase [Clostridium sp. AL.422]